METWEKWNFLRAIIILMFLFFFLIFVIILSLELEKFEIKRNQEIEILLNHLHKKSQNNNQPVKEIPMKK